VNHADDQTQLASVGEILIEEFMAPMGLTQGALAKATGVQRKHVDELCNDCGKVTARPR
jgi:addiction module HigA family antidote